MNKTVNYFLWLIAVIFTVSCTEEGEDLAPVNVNPDAKSAITFLVDGIDSTEITQKVGESVSFVAVMSYGDENPDNLVLLSNGKEIQTHSLANSSATIKITYTIPVDTAVSKILLTTELRKESTSLVSEDFTVNVLANDTENPVTAVDTASITLQVDGADAKQITQTAGETATFMVAIDYGDTGADQLVVTNANNGEKVKEISLATTPATVEVSYDIDATTAAGDINLKVELFQQNEKLDSDTFTITVEEKEEPTLTVSAIIEGESNFSIFAQALNQTGLAKDLKEEGSFTILAPTDAAFEAFMDDLGIERNELLARSDLANILRHHKVEGKFVSDAIKNGQKAETQLGLDITFEVSSDAIKIDGIKLDLMDLVGSNGVVHSIGTVLSPQSDLVLYESIFLSSPTGDESSNTFFNTSDGQQYSKQDAENNSKISKGIDFGYYYGATHEASLSSPDHYPNGFYDMTAWGTLNNTNFRPVADGFTAEDFSSYSSTLSMLFKSAKAEDETGSITNLQMGSIFTFKTSDGRYGLLLVDNIKGRDNSQDGITISVKVENKQ